MPPEKLSFANTACTDLSASVAEVDEVSRAGILISYSKATLVSTKVRSGLSTFRCDLESKNRFRAVLEIFVITTKEISRGGLN